MSDEWELFDLIEDPMEMHSVYDDPRYGEIRRNLESRLERQKEQFDVPSNEPLRSGFGT